MRIHLQTTLLSNTMIVENIRPEQYEELLIVWENSVRATHDFITEEDIMDSVKEEYKMLKELGVIQTEPKDEMYQTISDGILQWIKGDVEGIKRSMAEYEKKLQEYAREEAAKKPKIEVAGANVLNQLDNMAGAKGKLIV